MQGPFTRVFSRGPFSRGAGGGGAVVPLASVDARGFTGQWDGTPPSTVLEQAFSRTVDGFTTAGAATAYSDTIYATIRLVGAFPDHETLTASGVGLSDVIYATDVVGAATNNSTQVSPKPVANWATRDRQIVGDSLDLEVLAFHRDARNGEPIACIVFTVSDGTDTVTETVSVSTATEATLTGLYRTSYKATIDVSSLADPATLTVNALVYPWFGVAASVLGSADQTNRQEFTDQTYLRNTSLAAAPVLVYVDPSTGNDTTGAVSTNAATAAASPCLTISGAISRALAVNSDLGGVRIRLVEATHTLGVAAGTKAQTVAETIIEGAPGTDPAAVIVTFGTTWRPRLGASGTGAVRFKDLTMNRTSTVTLSGEAAVNLEIVFDNVIFDNNANNFSIYSGSDGYWIDTEIQASAANFLSAGGAGEHRRFLGCQFPTGIGALEGWYVVNCKASGQTGPLHANGKSENGKINAFNEFTDVQSGTSGLINIGIGASATNVIGCAIVGNVVETTTNVNNPMIFISSDNAIADTTHVIMWHNSFIGAWIYGRMNAFYNDTTADPRSHTLLSMRGNIYPVTATKHDEFFEDGTRIGGWSYLYGVGCYGELSMYINVTSFPSDFVPRYYGTGPVLGNSESVPLSMDFADYQGVTVTPTAGAGGGDYRIGLASAAAGAVTRTCLRFDLDGNARSASAASAGAYEAA